MFLMHGVIMNSRLMHSDCLFYVREKWYCTSAVLTFPETVRSRSKKHTRRCQWSCWVFPMQGVIYSRLMHSDRRTAVGLRPGSGSLEIVAFQRDCGATQR